MSKRHHVVSRGYQRFFADGERIKLVTKATRHARIVGTGDAFVRDHFNSFNDGAGTWVDTLEQKWAELEDEALPLIRGLIAGADSDHNRNAVKILAAIHFGRSYAIREMIDRIVGETVAAHAASADGEERLREMFRKQYGREAQPGEIRTMIEERAAAQFGGQRQLIRDMARGYNVALDKLIPTKVQLVWPRSKRAEFITGDGPFVYANGPRVGVRQGVPLGDATHLYMPLAPCLAAAFTTNDEEDGEVPPSVVQRQNLLIWQSASRHVACHPSTNASLALATTIVDRTGSPA